MSPDLFLAFVAAVTILMLIPGPNVALIVANSVAHGARYGLLTVAGTLSAQIIQLSLVAVGLAGFVSQMGAALLWVRWAGVAYLVYLAVQQWRTPPADLAAIRSQPKDPWRLVRRSMLVSLANPKTLFFYSAFLPQFIAADRPPGPQVAMLAVVFVVLAGLIDSLWALLAARARRLLGRHARLHNRISGGFLFGAAAGLAAIRTK